MLGVTVLGTELPVDRITSQTINLTDSTSIDPSNLSPAQLGVPGVDITLLQPVLDDAAHDLRAGRRRDRARRAGPPDRPGGGRLTQHALDVKITLGGQNVLDLTVGEATVGAANVNCGGVADLALQCTSRRIVLIDVLRSKGKVRLFGAANRRYAGRRVKIRFTRHRQGRRAPAGAQQRALHGHREAPAARGCAPPTAPATAPRSPRRRACGSSSCGGCSSRARP